MKRRTREVCKVNCAAGRKKHQMARPEGELG